MLRIYCPICGLRDHSEFDYGGDATVAYPALDADQSAWVEAVYKRTDPKGPHLELWRHSRGCRHWIVLERNTVTHEIGASKLAHPGLDALVAS